MTMDQQQLAGWRGQDLTDSSGSKIGTIADVYLDDDTGQPEWLAVTTGMFGSKVSFVPLAGTTTDSGSPVCRFSKDQVKGAPRAEADGQLSQEEEARLYEYYGLSYSEQRSDSGLPAGGQPNMAARTTGDRETSVGRDTGYDTSGPTTDSAMTRSEEEIRVGTQSRQAGQARLRKWVETEHVTETVPVRREQVRVEREPITDANIGQATSGPEISEEEHVMPLYEEEVVADTRVVPKERVRLDKDVVTEQERVEADLRKERIEVEGDTDPAMRR